MGETLGHYENHVTLNKQVVDAWGMPTLNISTKYTTNETNMAKDYIDTMAAMAEAAGFEVLVKNYEFNPPGYSIHEQGTARMSDDPKKGVVNKWNQSHDMKNLFITDASVFVSCRLAESDHHDVRTRHACVRIPGRGDAQGERLTFAALILLLSRAASRVAVHCTCDRIRLR